MAAVVVPIVMRMREQKKLEHRQWADGDEEGHDSNLMKQARAALTIKTFILRRSCLLALGTSYRFGLIACLSASTCLRPFCLGALLKACACRSQKLRLHHRNLTDRLMFEGNLRTGLKTLLLQTLLFVFLILGSSISSNNPQAAGMRAEIVESFALDSIEVSCRHAIASSRLYRKKTHAVMRRPQKTTAQHLTSCQHTSNMSGRRGLRNSVQNIRTSREFFSSYLPLAAKRSMRDSLSSTLESIPLPPFLSYSLLYLSLSRARSALSFLLSSFLSLLRISCN